jgi:hypothetical protein
MATINFKDITSSFRSHGRNSTADHGLVKETVLAEDQMTNRLTLFFGAHLAAFALVLVLAR